MKYHLSKDLFSGLIMTNAELLNKLLKKYNQADGLKLLKDELGPERVKYEMEKFNFQKLTFENFLDIAQEWGFYEDYISDENWEKFKDRIEY